MMQKVLLSGCAGLLAAVACGGCERSGERGAPSVLIVTLDTTRADRLGCYGRAGAKTPAIDSLAQSGVRFADALCQVPLTLPSHTSMFTGTYPATNGVRVNGQMSGPGVTTLAEVFRQRGYRTGAFVGALVLDSSFGLDRGFDTYDDELGGYEVVERAGDKVTDSALRWLATPSEKPFFAWVHYFDPHHPHEPPLGFREGFPTPYDGEIAFVDSQVARLLAWLDDNDRRESTLIVVVGDHGEAFEEHGEIGHGLFVYNTTMQVPLVFSCAGKIPAGKTVAPPVGLIDLFSTIVELMSWDIPDGVEGTSLVPAWQDAAIDRPVYAESEYARIGFGWAGLQSLTTDQWKFIEAPRSELYDRSADRAENSNVIADHPQVAEQMRAKLRSMRASMVLRTEPGAAGSEEMRSRLRSLGYVGGGSTTEPDDASERRDPKDMIGAYQAHAEAVEHQLEGRYAQVVAIMEPLVELSPESDDFHGTLGVAYLELGRAADAEREFAASLRIAPDNPRQLWRMADALYRQNQVDKAVAHVEAALALDPDLAVAHCTLGDILEQKGQAANAIEHFEAAVAASPNLARAHSRLGVAYANQGRFAEAEKHLRRYVELEPESPHALVNLGSVLYRMRRPTEAAELLQRALKYDPGNPAAHMSLFQALLASQKTQEGIEALRRARAALPEARVLTLRLAWLLATTSRGDLRRPEEALALARELCEAGNPTADELTVLAAAYASTGDFGQAYAHARKAVSLAEARGDTAALAKLRVHLRHYEAGRPYVE